MGRVFIIAVLFMSGWISFSVCEFYTVAALPGEEVKLLCLNFTRIPTHINWFRLNQTSKVSPISSLDNSDGSAYFFEEFRNSSFSVTSNKTHMFLTIKAVEFSHSGLYICGNQPNGSALIVSATYLEVRAIDGNIPMNTILGALIAFLSIIIIILAFMIRKRHKAPKDEQNPQPSQVAGCEDVNYAALRFHSKQGSRRRNEADNKEQMNVVYAATR